MKKRILSMAIALCMLISLLPAEVFAETGKEISSGNFASTEGMWNGKSTKNLIPTPTLPSYDIGDGKDTSKWKSFWNGTMVPAGWGSAGISGDDDALQVYQPTADDTFAIRPVKSGSASGGDACLGGAGELSCRSTGVSYTVKLDSKAQQLANEGNLTTLARADFYRQKGYLYRFAFTFEFYNASGTKLSGVGSVPTYNSSDYISKEIDADGVYVNWYVLSANDDGYLSRWASNIKVPKDTVYIRYWYANLGGGNDRKSIKNMEAYLATPHSGHTGWTEYTGSKEATSITKDTNIYLSGDTTLSGNLIIVSGNTVNLCLNGKTLDLGTNHIANNGTLIICDCQNTHGTIKSTDDYAIRNTGTLIMNGGTVTSSEGYGIYNEGAAKISGGTVKGTTGIPNKSTGTLTISGTATVTGTSTNGITNTGTLTMTGGNVSSDNNYGIYNEGTAKISGGTVTSSSSCGIYNKGTYTMTGGTVSGATGIENNNNSVVEISGSPTIKGTSDYGITNKQNSSLYLSGSPKISGLIADIYYSPGSIYAHERDNNSSAYSGGKLEIYVYDTDYCLGKVIVNDVTDANEEKFVVENSGFVLERGTDDNSDDLILAKIPVYKTVSTGDEFEEEITNNVNDTNYIRLSSCIKLDGKGITVNKPVVVDLNGYTINTAERGTFISGSPSMTFKNGYIKAGSTAFFNSEYDNTGPDYILENLIVTNTGDICAYVGYAGTLNAVNCSLSNSSGPAIQGDREGAVFTLTDCYLKGSEYAYTCSSSTLTLDGAAITDDASSNVYDGGFVNNIESRHNPLSGTKCTICNDTNAHTHSGVTFEDWTATGGSVASGSYYLTNSITATGNITIASESDVNLCLNGKTLDLGTNHIANNGTLTICDCQSEPGTIKSGANFESTIENYGTLKMTGGKINSEVFYGIGNRNTAKISGGFVTGATGIYNIGQDAALEISGDAKITGTANNAVTNDGTLTMTGGEVECKYANYSGIKNHQGAKAIISQGTVSAVSDGISGSGEITVSGGTVKGNNGIKSEDEDSIITISGDDTKITGTSYKGIVSYGTLNINGGTISTNSTSASANGAIYADGTVTITKGKIVTVNTGYTSGIDTMSNANIIINPANNGDVVFETGGYCISANRGSAITVNGGTFTSFKYPAVCVAYTASKGITINGGLFETRSSSSDVIHSLGVLNITGGTFTSAGGKTLKISADSSNANQKTKVTITGNVSLPNGILFSGSSIGKNYAEEYILDISGYTGNKISTSIDTTNITLSKGALLAKGSTDKLSLTNEGYILKQNGNDIVLDNAHTHVWETAWSSDASAHWHNCTAEGCDITVNSEKNGYEVHSAPDDDGDCTTDIKCETCGYVFTKGNTVHSFNTRDSGTKSSDATCISEQKNLVQCDNCDKISNTFTVPVANTKLNHKYTYTKTSDTVITESCDKGCGHSKTATITAPSGTLTYNGTREFTASVTYSEGWKGEKPSVIYARNTIATTDTKPAGSYTASVTIDTKAISVSYTVQKADGKTDGISDISKIYDSTPVSAPLFNKLGTGTATVLYKTKNADDSEYSASAPKNAGEYTVKVTVSADNNYKEASATADFTISKKPLTITANPKTITYGDAPGNSGVTYTGFAGTENEGVLDGTLNYSYGYALYGNVGSYTITPGGLTANNYNITFAPGTLTVNQLEAEIEWSALSDGDLVYDGAANTLSATVKNKKNNDDVEFVISLTGDNTAVTPDGFYYTASNLTGDKKGNYNLTSPLTSPTYHVTKNTVTKPSVPSKVFDGTVQTGDVPESPLYTVSENDGGVNAGVYNVELTLNDTNNYKWSDTEDASTYADFEITKAVNTFTSMPAIEGWVYGQPNEPTGTAVFGTVAYNYYDSSYQLLGGKPENAGSYYMKGYVEANSTYSLSVGSNYDRIESPDYVAFTISKATPVILAIPTADRIRAGAKLGVSNLTGGIANGVAGTPIEGTFAWETPLDDMNTVGNISKNVIFTPSDTLNYNNALCSVTIEVYKKKSGSSRKNYKVTFDTNGGSKVSSKTVLEDTLVDEPKEPAYEGFTFDGWYTDKELSKEYDFKDKVTRSFTLYAKWTEVKKEDDSTDDSKWNPFTDVTQDDWFHDVIKDAYLDGLITGTSKDLFSPDGDITRGMFVTVLWRAENEPDISKLYFDDVKKDEYYAKAVAWGYENGIVLGYSESQYAPDDNITREQMAAILWRYAKYKNADVSVGENTNILSYLDFFDITEYAIPAMQWASGEGIISGKGNGILDPLGNATRAEAVAMLIRFIK